MSELRFGIIGCGVQGSLYAAVLSGTAIPGMPPVRRPEGCVLTAVSSRREEAMAPIKAMNPTVHCFTDWRELVQSDVCDAVIITVPHYQHHTIAMAALEAGKHVLCEKPAGVRASDAARIVSCAEAHPDLTAAMMLNQRCNPVFRQVKAWLDSGELGQLRRSNWIINSWWRPDSYYRSSPWRGTWAGEGGGVLVNQLPHQLDLWQWLCGKPKTVWAKCVEGAYRSIEVENDVTIVTTYETGATGTLVSCTHDPLGTNRLEIDCSKGKIVVENGVAATLWRFKQDETVWNETISFREMTGLQMTRPEALYEEETFMDRGTFGSEYVGIFENFAAHVQTGIPLIATAADGLAAVQLANAAQLSGWIGAEVTFPCDTAQYDQCLREKVQTQL